MVGGFRIRRFDALAASLVVAFAWLVLGISHSDLNGYASGAGADGFQPLGWRNLKLLDLETSEADPRLVRLGGRLVRIPSYIAPVEDPRSGAFHFPFVRYVGASIHMPPTPEDQALSRDMGGGAVESETWGPYW